MHSISNVIKIVVIVIVFFSENLCFGINIKLPVVNPVYNHKITKSIFSNFVAPNLHPNFKNDIDFCCSFNILCSFSVGSDNKIKHFNRIPL